MVFNPLKPLRSIPVSAIDLNTSKEGAIANYLRTILSHSPLPMALKSMETSYPLSPLQQGMLFHNLHEPESGVDLEQIVCTLRETLELAPFVQAWKQLLERHPILRTSFKWNDLDEPCQEVYQGVPLPLTQHDWRDLSEAEQRDRHQAYLQDDRRRGFDLTRAPLMRLALFRLKDAECRLIWTFHHILLDGRSFTLLLKEVFALYEAICQKSDGLTASPSSLSGLR